MGLFINMAVAAWHEPRRLFTWRGSLFPAEVRYEPGGAADGAPVLRGPVDVAGLVAEAATGADDQSLLGAARLYAFVYEALAGLHGLVDADAEAQIRGGYEEGLLSPHVSFEASFRLLNELGVLGRTGGRLGIGHVPAPRASSVTAAAKRLAATSYRVWEGAAFSGAPREDPVDRYGVALFRRLVRHEQVRVIVGDGRISGDRLPPGPSAHSRGSYDPPSIGVLLKTPARVRGGLPLSRASVATSGIVIPPSVLTSMEVAALVNGGFRGANAMRRAMRAAVLWGVLVSAGVSWPDPVTASTRGLAREFAEACGLKGSSDHRQLLRNSLHALSAAGLIDHLAERTGSVVHVAFRRPLAEPASSRFRREFARWALDDSDPAAHVIDRLVAFDEVQVRRAWRQLVNAQRIAVTVTSTPVNFATNGET
jgi:hypothetical protein